MAGDQYQRNMRKLLILFAACCLAAACTKKPQPEEIVAQTAKTYYERLLQGKYEEFVDGRFQPDSIPAGYREQLIANARMFVGQQQDEHRGIKQIRVANAKADTARHTANVFLVFAYGDSTNEEVVVPMVEHHGVWYMR